MFEQAFKNIDDVLWARLDTAFAEAQRLEAIFRKKLAALHALKKSLLHQAFSVAL